MRPLTRPALTASLALALVATASPAFAVPLTSFQMPFPCGQTWTGSTRSGHSPSTRSIDWNRTDDAGSAVVASAPGVVAKADATSRSGYGHHVVVDHQNGESTLYAHLDAVVVAAGQRVDQGAQLGTVGATGNARGAHLHFEEKSGKSVIAAWFAGAPYRYGAATSANCVDVPIAGNFVGRRRRRGRGLPPGEEVHVRRQRPRGLRPGGALRSLDRRARRGRLGRRRRQQRGHPGREGLEVQAPDARRDPQDRLRDPLGPPRGR